MKNLFTFLLLLLATTFYAQSTINGVVTDAESGDYLIGASVVIDGTTTGTITDLDGEFTLSGVESGNQSITINYVGYSPMSMAMTINEGENDLGVLNLFTSAIGLREVMIVADVAIDRRTPVAVSKISSQVIEDKLGNQEFPEIMKMTPSIYATKTSGGFGDSRINIRGFKQEDVALLINGIPVNGMEDNKIYWSNWAGLGDVTRSIQVQRGLGASKLAVASVGGTINILTKTTDQEKGGNFYMGIGNDNYRKYGMTLSTGLTDKGWAFTFSGSRTTGDGYIDYNYIDAWTYFFSASKQINKRNLIMLTGFGAPQRHGQRSFEHNIGDLKNKYGKRWNDDSGKYQGSDFGWRENFYHKPQVGLSHIFNMNEKTDIVTSAYVSVGRGGGTGDIGSTREFLIGNNSYGQEDFDAIAAWNAGNASLQGKDPIQGINVQFEGQDTTFSQVASKENGGIIKRASMNEHQWVGVLSSVKHDISSNLNFSGGVDLRWYTGSHYRKAIDLLGAEYWFDNDNKNLQGDQIFVPQSDGTVRSYTGILVRPQENAASLFGSIPDEHKIDYHNDENINWYGTFGQIEYSNMGGLSAFVSGAVNLTQMRRTDFFITGDQTTDWTSFIGGNVKLGANYNINSRNNIFANVGYISRAPYFDVLYPTFSNDNPNEDVNNERITAFELGYGYRAGNFQANLNGYYTIWKDKNEVFSDTYSINDSTSIFGTYNLLGVDATHTGVEVDFTYNVTKYFDLTGFASLGDWRWKSNPEAVVSDDDNTVVGMFDLYIDDLKVGDAAQTTFGLGGALDIGAGLSVDAQYLYSSQLYAAYDPQARDDSGDAATQPFELPGFGLTDLGLTWKFGIGSQKARLRANINNLFNTEYVSEANDRIGETDINNLRGWVGFGRTWNVNMKVYF